MSQLLEHLRDRFHGRDADVRRAKLLGQLPRARTKIEHRGGRLQPKRLSQVIDGGVGVVRSSVVAGRRDATERPGGRMHMVIHGLHAM